MHSWTAQTECDNEFAGVKWKTVPSIMPSIVVLTIDGYFHLMLDIPFPWKQFATPKYWEICVQNQRSILTNAEANGDTHCHHIQRVGLKWIRFIRRIYAFNMKCPSLYGSNEVNGKIIPLRIGSKKKKYESICAFRWTMTVRKTSICCLFSYTASLVLEWTNSMKWTNNNRT